MTRVGISVSESDKHRELTVQLRAYHPAVADIVTDYEKETDIGARTWSSLIDFVLL
jgi:flagellar biosynthesis/type III secretory pathway chaperone